MPFPVPHSPRRAARTFRCLVIALAAVLSAPAVAEASNRFEHLREQDLRVASVAYRLAISNTASCGEALEPQLGFVIHGLGQYPQAAREGAGSHFGLGERLGVMAVVADSPAASAGLGANAALISVNGRELAGAGEGAPGRAAAERAGQMIVEELKKGPVALRVSGPDGERTVRFGAVAGCSSRVELQPALEVNAWADGARVVLTTAMLDQCRTDDDLALVIGHEMAHNVLGHRDRLASMGVSATRAASAADLAKIRDAEDEADRFAAGMARTAGYDLARAASFIERLVKASGLTSGAAATHSAPSLRLASWATPGSAASHNL